MKKIFWGILIFLGVCLINVKVNAASCSTQIIVKYPDSKVGKAEFNLNGFRLANSNDITRNNFNANSNKDNDILYDSSASAYYLENNTGSIVITNLTVPEGFDKLNNISIIVEDCMVTTIDNDNVTVEKTGNINKVFINMLVHLPHGSIKINVHDSDTNARIPGAKFGVYAESDITSNTGEILTKDTLINSATSNSGGTIEFNNLALGSYYVKEIDSPSEYGKTGFKTSVNIDYDGYVHTLSAYYTNSLNDMTNNPLLAALLVFGVVFIVGGAIFFTVYSRNKNNK